MLGAKYLEKIAKFKYDGFVPGLYVHKYLYDSG